MKQKEMFDLRVTSGNERFLAKNAMLEIAHQVHASVNTETNTIPYSSIQKNIYLTIKLPVGETSVTLGGKQQTNNVYHTFDENGKTITNAMSIKLGIAEVEKIITMIRNSCGVPASTAIAECKKLGYCDDNGVCTLQREDNNGMKLFAVSLHPSKKEPNNTMVAFRFSHTNPEISKTAQKFTFAVLDNSQKSAIVSLLTQLKDSAININTNNNAVEIARLHEQATKVWEAMQNRKQQSASIGNVVRQDESETISVEIDDETDNVAVEMTPYNDDVPPFDDDDTPAPPAPPAANTKVKFNPSTTDADAPHVTTFKKK